MVKKRKILWIDCGHIVCILDSWWAEETSLSTPSAQDIISSRFSMQLPLSIPHP